MLKEFLLTWRTCIFICSKDGDFEWNFCVFRQDKDTNITYIQIVFFRKYLPPFIEFIVFETEVYRPTLATRNFKFNRTTFIFQMFCSKVQWDLLKRDQMERR